MRFQLTGSSLEVIQSRVDLTRKKKKISVEGFTRGTRVRGSLGKRFLRLDRCRWEKGRGGCDQTSGSNREY